MKDNDLRKAQIIMLDMLKDIDRVCRENNIEYCLDGGTLLGAARHKGFIPWDDDLDIVMMRDEYDKFINIFSRELGHKYDIETNIIKKDYIVPWTKIFNRENFVIYNRDIDINKGIFIDIFPLDYYDESSRVVRWIENILKEEKVSNNIIHKITNKIIHRIQYYMINKFPLIYKRIASNIIKNTNKKSELIGIGKEVIRFKFYFNKDTIFPLREIEFEGLSFLAPNNIEKYLEINYGKDWNELPPVEERKKHCEGFIFD